jgi:hypothetical protein
MCVTFTEEWRKTTKDLIVYKVVYSTNDDVWVSPFPVSTRTKQDNCKTRGRKLFYKKGELVVGGEAGLYCMSTYSRAYKSSCYDEDIIALKVPKGSLIRHGRVGWGFVPSVMISTINVEKAEVIGKVKKPIKLSDTNKKKVITLKEARKIALDSLKKAEKERKNN